MHRTGNSRYLLSSSQQGQPGRETQHGPRQRLRSVCRDPDALLDLIELETTDTLIDQEENKAVCNACIQYLDSHFEWAEDLGQDALCSSGQMLAYCEKRLTRPQMEALRAQIGLAKQKVKQLTAWRIEGTLREFPKFDPVNVWFDYPVHRVDKVDSLKDIQPEEEKAPWQKAMSKRKDPAQKKKERKEAVETAFEACGIGEKVTVKDLAEYMATTEKTVRNRLKEHGGFEIEDGEVRKKT